MTRGLGTAFGLGATGLVFALAGGDRRPADAGRAGFAFLAVVAFLGALVAAGRRGSTACDGLLSGRVTAAELSSPGSPSSC